MQTTLTRDFVLTDAERELLPSDQDVADYATHGWYLSKKLLTDDEVDALLSASERFYAGELSRRLPGRPPTLAYWEPTDGPVLRYHDYIHYESDEIGAILRKPLIGAVAARLAEAREIRVFQSTLTYQPARPDGRSKPVPWHVDRRSWRTCTSDRMLSAFIPFHDCPEEMGAITVIDGSHRWRQIGADDSTSNHSARRGSLEPEEALKQLAEANDAEIVKVPVVVPKGHMSFHHCRTYYGSAANTTRLPRRAVSLHLQDGENQYRGLVRSDGSTVVHNHDYFVSRTLIGEPDYTDPVFCPTIWRD
jgi:hypothetical protein